MCVNNAYHVQVSSTYPTTNWTGGETAQLFIYPPGATVGTPGKRNFICRVSRATVVEKKDTFGDFTGFDRILFLLRGKGIVLKYRLPGQRKNGGGEKNITLSNRFERHDFSGDLTVQSELVDGPITDFNIITARERVEATARVHKFQKGFIDEVMLDGTFHVFYVAQGEVSLAYGRTGERFIVGEGSTLVLDGAHRPDDASPEMMSLQTLAPQAIVIAVGLYLKVDSST